VRARRGWYDVGEVDPETLQRDAAFDARLVEAAKEVKVLSHLAWPARLLDEFLAHWKLHNPRLPEVPRPHLQFGANIGALRSVMDECDTDEPVGRYLFRTARSYVTAARMVERIGTAEFTQRSIELYGAPRDRIGPNAVTNLEAAEQFLSLTDDFPEVGEAPEDVCLRPEYVAEQLRQRLALVFVAHPIAVDIDPEMASKAAAGARRVRIRGATCFSQQDIAPLAEHEVFVHSLTSINGREQPLLKTMGLGSPRTTATQEGLATFAELITNAMDLSRLRRLALRVKAIQMGLDGADFIDVFRFFLGSGQSQEESFHSTARVFRGGDVRGRIVFTKDVVYLQGLIAVHTFFLKAIHQGRPEYIRDLFSGRMAVGDVLDLDAFFRSGAIAPPLYEPAWIKSQTTLAAFLVYSIFNTQLRLGTMDLADFHEPAPESG
jgi:uncharacterized protein (TIGR02421 family)